MSEEIRELIFIITCLVLVVFVGSCFVYLKNDEINTLDKELKRLQIEKLNKEILPTPVICTWDIPAEHIGADLPPLPVRKHKN